jgi:hypothetical protein
VATLVNIGLIGREDRRDQAHDAGVFDVRGRGQRQEELRDAARLMNPQTDSNYEPTFEALVYENYTLRMLRGQLRGTNRNTKSC